MRQVAQHTRVAVAHATQDASLPWFQFHHRPKLLRGQGAVFARDRVAVRAVRRVAAQPVHAILERAADGVFQPVCLDVDLIPGKAHHLDQEDFEQPVPADELERGQHALFREQDAVGAGAIDETGFLKALEHTADGGRRDMHLLGQRRSRHLGRTASRIAAQFIDGSQIVQHAVGCNSTESLH